MVPSTSLVRNGKPSGDGKKLIERSNREKGGAGVQGGVEPGFGRSFMFGS